MMLDAEKFSIAAGKNQLKHACGVAGDVASGVVFIKGAADDVIDFLFLARFLSLTRR